MDYSWLLKASSFFYVNDKLRYLKQDNLDNKPVKDIQSLTGFTLEGSEDLVSH